MISRILLLCITFLLSFTRLSLAEDWNALEEYPHVVLSNGSIEMSVFLADREKGFYRSSRFDWSGMVWQLTCNGHTFFIPRHTPHDPENNGHGMSLAEEFSIGTNKKIPQRYPETKAGETFMKVGAGLLCKPADDPKYFFAGKYEIADPGTWTTEYGRNWITFTHVLQDEYGFGYVYEKHMELIDGKQELVIHSSLKNTGNRAILEDHYNHNFFTIDNTPIGPDYAVEFAFAPIADEKRMPPKETAAVNGKNLIYHKQVEKSFLLIFNGYTESPDDGCVRIKNTHTGAGVEVGGDFPLYGFNFYTSPTTLSPELFIKIAVNPGETQKWTRTYRFFTE